MKRIYTKILIKTTKPWSFINRSLETITTKPIYVSIDMYLYGETVWLLLVAVHEASRFYWGGTMH